MAILDEAAAVKPTRGDCHAAAPRESCPETPGDHYLPKSICSFTRVLFLGQTQWASSTLTDVTRLRDISSNVNLLFR